MIQPITPSPEPSLDVTNPSLRQPAPVVNIDARDGWDFDEFVSAVADVVARRSKIVKIKRRVFLDIIHSCIIIDASEVDVDTRPVTVDATEIYLGKASNRAIPHYAVTYIEVDPEGESRIADIVIQFLRETNVNGRWLITYTIEEV